MPKRHVIALVVSLACAHLCAADVRLLARYDFDEGKGETLHDRSGNNNHGAIHGATWLKAAEGHALRFDGVDDYVDCGSDPSLDVRGPLSLETWIYPEGTPEGEPGVIGKYFTSYLISYYRNNRIYLYVSHGRNNCNAPLMPGAWAHVVATFDGVAIKMYINGELAGSKPSKTQVVRPGKNFIMGMTTATPGADDPALAKPNFFKGIIDEVRIYKGALSAQDIRTRYEQTATGRSVGPRVAFMPATAGETIVADNCTLRVGERGAVQIDIEDESYLLESTFSYPDDAIGTNALSPSAGQSERRWRPKVRRRRNGTITVAARGTHYTLQRIIRPVAGRIEIEDTLTNRTRSPVAIMVRHTVTARDPFIDPHLSATAPNPTLFLAQPESRLGVLAEDNISRLQIKTGALANQASCELRHFALDARRSYTFRWALYPFKRPADYFTFINRVREDWGTNFTVSGPGGFAYFSARAGLVYRAAQLKARLKRKKWRLVMFIDPWLDYHTGQDLTREQYKAFLQSAARNLKAADPEIKILGNIESDWVPLTPKDIPGFEKLPVLEEGKSTAPALTPEQTKIIDDADLPWKDSYKRDPDGNLRMELYKGRALENGRVVVKGKYSAVAVYPEVGNYQYAFLMDQMRFLLDEVGLDGVYLDEFNQYGTSCRAYDKWDGHTVDIDPATGRIIRKYTDCGLVGAVARKNICDYVLGKGKILVANTCAVVNETQALPVYRFMELPLHSFNPEFLADAQKPPAITHIRRAHLASPIGLGIGIGYFSLKKNGQPHDDRSFTKGLITYLRNGLLYYHYDPNIPASGRGSGGYGPINHMYPITPVRMFEGGIEGKERTITCVSGTYSWKGDRPPRILLFDEVGRETQHNLKPVKTGDHWTVSIQLRDWQQIAVIEE